MGDREPLTRSEFLAQVGYIREDIQGTHERLDALNGRVRVNAENIVRLDTKHRDLRRDHESLKTDAKKGGSTYGGIAGGFVGGLIVALKAWLGGGQ